MISSSFRATLLVVVSAACFSSAVISPCLPYMAEYFVITSNQTSLLVSIFLFGYLSGQIFYSILSQSIGFKNTLLFGFLLYILGCVTQIIAIQIKSLEFLYYSRFLCSFGSSSGLICVFAIIKDYSEFKYEAQKLIALSFISLTLFAHLSITVGGIITQYYDWIWVFYFAMIVSILEFILIYKYIPCSKKSTRKTLGSIKKILSTHFISFFNLRLIFPSLIVAFTTTSTYLYNATAATISSTFFHIPSSIFGLISILNLISLLSGGWLGSSLTKKYQTSDVLLYGIFISLIPIVSLFLIHEIIFSSSNNGTMFFLSIAILNFGLGMIYPTASYLALNSIDSSTIASSTMNFLKISIPAFVIYSVSKFQIELISSYQYPLAFVSMIALFSSLIIKIKDLSKIE